MVDFKFAIGDEVTCRAMLSPFFAIERNQLAQEGKVTVTVPQKMVVIGRKYDECVGGVQLAYQVRIYETAERGWRTGQQQVAVVKDPYSFFEMELVPWSEAMEDKEGAP